MKAVLIGLSAALAVGTTLAQGPGGLKAGLWESRTLKMTVDGKDMLPQMKAAREQMQQSLAKLPPEQRKKMEAMMATQGGGDPTVQRMCVSAEMAKKEQPILPRPAHADCAEPKLDRNGNRTAFEFSCKQGEGTIAGKGETVATGDQVTTKVETVTSDKSGAKRTMVAETQMKFIGADCGGLKPLDQMIKEMQARRGAAAGSPTAPAKK